MKIAQQIIVFRSVHNDVRSEVVPISKKLKTRTRRRRILAENTSSYLFLIPWLIVLLLFTLYPFVEGIRMSLYDYSLKSQTYVGLGNFKALFADTAFWNSIIVTLKMCVIIIPCTILFSLGVAYAIQDLSNKVKSVVKVVFYISSMINQVALVMVWKWMFNPTYGLYKSLCDRFGFVELNLLGDATYSIPLISILVLSFTVSQPIVLFSAAMDGVPQIYYDAAELDGASRFIQFRKITLPQIRDVLLLVTVTTTINNLQVFVVPQLLTSGGPNGATTPVLLLIYRSAFEYGKYGYASAMGVVLFSVIAFLVAVQFVIQRRRGD